MDTEDEIEPEGPAERGALEALTEAWDVNSFPGASTATCAVLKGNELDIASLGDCKVLVVRAGELIEESIPQWHAFNMPQQLGQESPDTPEDSDCMVVNLEEEDVIILASDGLFDNVTIDAIIEEVNRMTGDEADPALTLTPTLIGR